jgi:hypothetical protein
MISKGPIRIGNVSGATGDMPTAMARMVGDDNGGGGVHVITGDWLSEMNIAWNAITKQSDPNLGYEDGFYQQLEGCLDDIVAKGIKVVTNAGALNTQALTRKVRDLVKAKGHDIVVAAVLGDDISHLLSNSSIPSLTHLDHLDRSLDKWDLKPLCGNAYIGCRGIVEALNAGASIVICGRVTDASPVMGAAAWHFGWDLDEQYDELAGALVAGHLIECGAYVVGAVSHDFSFNPDCAFVKKYH